MKKTQRASLNPVAEKLLSEQIKSRQSVAVFCRQRKLCDPQFYVWRKRLQEIGPTAARLLSPQNVGRQFSEYARSSYP